MFFEKILRPKQKKKKKKNKRRTRKTGNYELVDRDTMMPNPDFYAALLFKKVMFQRVLAPIVEGEDESLEKVRVWAHADENSEKVSLLVINFDESEPVVLNVTALTPSSTQNALSSPEFQPATWATTSSSSSSAPNNRLEYHLTAEDLHSKVVLLNGKELVPDQAGVLPPLEPRKVSDSSEPIKVLPLSVAFVVLPLL